MSFNELITLKKPEVIDFSDIKEDDPLTTNNMNELLERIQKERAINFPPLASVEVVDLSEDNLIKEEDSQINSNNSVKNISTSTIDYELHSKIDTLSSQLAQLLANQMLIMEKLNSCKISF